MSFKDRLMHGWNAFANNTSAGTRFADWGGSGASFGSIRPDRTRLRTGNGKDIIGSIYNRLGIDVAAVQLQHVKVDDNGRYKETVKSYLNECLTLEANIDQGSRAFLQDAAMTLFDKGAIAICPIDTTINPKLSMAFDIQTMRIGEITGWFGDEVKVSVYNEKTGRREEMMLPKKIVAIVENPLFTVMNEQNSTLQRLIRKLSLLDSIDEQAGSGKLDLIIQLPYVIKSEARKQQAEMRRKDIETQLQGSKYGIAYTDGTERITQLNRPAENNMHKQVETLTAQLYAQLGLTEDVFNGTANEATMLNYFNRTIEPILAAITQAMQRTFLSKTARTQGHAIMFFRDPFKLMTIDKIADLGDKMIRNQIMTPNEIRGIMGMKPADDPKADQLNNPNVPNDPSKSPADPTLDPTTDPNAPPLGVT
ncbi:portal protein [Arthrobacter phage Sloopyjoe]|nr:portal protein [Arthrobacter phage Stayer]QFG09721.1 portal protein [Arthrobacter phage Shiba]QFG11726.1 portal protein [Arthrobacter phage Salk]QFG12609.1 portal protein [Arthrobacter phage Michelle]QFG14382.1 portal protein [Arthrobacter phage StarLord]UVT31090.1 portal protein [Arthrobacter phage Linda]WAB09428.1 portal protein [Arthrobacter phage Sloopyjoe]WKW85730.1 portal protein [Arthrobacter phage MrAaronian]WNO27617.1 portal protein [Arthrobacter phage Djungelskog]